MIKIFLLYFIVISIVAVCLTVYDKLAAKRHGFRISEATLLLCGAFFGAAAELITMLLIRHKTRHPRFMLGLPVMLVVQTIIIIGFWFYWGRYYA